MGKFFSDAVEQALGYIYYDMRAGKGKEGFALLQKASEEGDGDATYFLSRCYSGMYYVWEHHGFPEDDNLAGELVRKSVAQGSAVGVLGAMRCNELKPAVRQTMPFESLKQAWDIVLEKARGGEPFCAYMIGNTYFWGDILTIDHRSRESFANEAENRAYLKEQVEACIPWFEQAFENGVEYAGRNLMKLYGEGESDLVPPRPEKVPEINRQGAEKGYPNWQFWYGGDLRRAERYEEALSWFEKAATGGHVNAWGNIGFAYEMGQGVEKDAVRALENYERGLDRRTGNFSFVKAGNLYFLGQDGVPQDYARAVQLFDTAVELGDKWCCPMLAYCYLEGKGCRQDYARAKYLLELTDREIPRTNYCLGRIYAEGLGVPQDIPKGVAYFQKNTNNALCRDELLKYKKTLLGKWVRR